MAHAMMRAPLTVCVEGTLRREARQMGSASLSRLAREADDHWASCHGRDPWSRQPAGFPMFSRYPTPDGERGPRTGRGRCEYARYTRRDSPTRTARPRAAQRRLVAYEQHPTRHPMMMRQVRWAQAMLARRTLGRGQRSAPGLSGSISHGTAARAQVLDSVADSKSESS